MSIGNRYADHSFARVPSAKFLGQRLIDRIAIRLRSIPVTLFPSMLISPILGTHFI